MSIKNPKFSRIFEIWMHDPLVVLHVLADYEVDFIIFFKNHENDVRHGPKTNKVEEFRGWKYFLSSRKTSYTTWSRRIVRKRRILQFLEMITKLIKPIRRLSLSPFLSVCVFSVFSLSLDCFPKFAKSAFPNKPSWPSGVINWSGAQKNSLGLETLEVYLFSGRVENQFRGFWEIW